MKFSTNGVRITPERARVPGLARDYVDVQISLDGATAEVNDYVRGPGSYDMALTALANLQDAGFQDAKISVVCTRQNIGQLDEFKALADRVRRHPAADPAAPVGPRRRRVGRAAPAARAAARALRLADGARRGRADRRLVLPPRRVRRGAARAQPVRRRPGGLPDRPGRRRLRLPVRDPRQLPGRQPARRRRLPAGLADLRAVRRSCARRRPAARARSASSSTPAAAAAWRRSSSPACRSTVRTPSASRGTASRRSPATASIPAASQDHSKANPTRNQPVMLQLLTRPRRPPVGLRREPARRLHP